MTQTGTLTQYIYQLEFLCNQLGIDMETKLHLFIHFILIEALVLQELGDYNRAVTFVKHKESTTQTNYDEIRKKLGRDLQS